MLSIIIILFGLLLITCLRLFKVEPSYRRLTKNHHYLQALINHIPDLTWVKDKESRFLLVNDQFSKAFGFSKEDILGKTDFDLSSNPEQAQSYYDDDMKTMHEQKVIHTEEKITTENGSFGWSETIKVPIYDQHSKIAGTAGMTRDITKRKLAEQKIVHIAYHDELTDLPNRIHFVQHITKLLSLNNCAVALILFDLNNFKIINDSLGHRCGDKALIQISDRLKTLVNENTIVARLSGDEFVIAHNYAKLENSFEKLQAELLQLFEAPVVLKDLNYNIRASFGISVAPHDGRDHETLLQHADLAMAQSKLYNHKHCVYFIQKFADDLHHKMTLSNRLHQGISKNEFSLVYQPKINSNNNTLIGVESLLRWNIDNKLSVSPAEFIPIAEKNGFIIEIGNWVIKNVFIQIRKWLDKEISIVPVSINVSAIQLRQPLFIDYLFQQLEHYQIPGNLVEIELTEGVLMENIEETTALLQLIRDKDIAISIDDFGTGYSSLSYLPILPINTLKIDRSFIIDLQNNSDNQKIIQTIVNLAENFNLSVIAEGVETKEELAQTSKCGIHNVQGYYYSKPLPVDELEKNWLKPPK